MSDLRSAMLTREGESARPPTEAFSSSIDGGTHLALSETSGLILILNFFLLSSSSSESLEEKKCFSLGAGGHVSRTKGEKHHMQHRGWRQMWPSETFRGRTSQNWRAYLSDVSQLIILHRWSESNPNWTAGHESKCSVCLLTLPAESHTQGLLIQTMSHSTKQVNMFVGNVSERKDIIIFITGLYTEALFIYIRRSLQRERTKHVSFRLKPWCQACRTPSSSSSSSSYTFSTHISVPVDLPIKPVRSPVGLSLSSKMKKQNNIKLVTNKNIIKGTFGHVKVEFCGKIIINQYLTCCERCGD